MESKEDIKSRIKKAWLLIDRVLEDGIEYCRVDDKNTEVITDKCSLGSLLDLVKHLENKEICDKCNQLYSNIALGYVRES